MNIRLFEIDENTHMVDLNKTLIGTIKEFKTILKRDRSRTKTEALKEFTFLYHYCDYRSPFLVFSEKDRLTNALRNAELSEDVDIYKDKDLLAAIEAYKVLQYTPTLAYMSELLQGLHTAKKVIYKIRTDLEKRLDNDDLDASEIIADGPKGKKTLVDPLTIIAQRLDKIIDYANKLPHTLNSLELLDEKVKKQLADIPELKGGMEKGATEDAPKGETHRPNPMMWE